MRPGYSQTRSTSVAGYSERPSSKAAAPRLTLVSRFTFHGTWERRENTAGGLCQQPVVAFCTLLTDPASATTSSGSSAGNRITNQFSNTVRHYPMTSVNILAILLLYLSRREVSWITNNTSYVTHRYAVVSRW